MNYSVKKSSFHFYFGVMENLQCKCCEQRTSIKSNFLCFICLGAIEKNEKKQKKNSSFDVLLLPCYETKKRLLQ